MNKIVILIISQLFSYLLIKSQDFSKEFGKVSKEEIDLKEYSRDENAKAVVLFDIGKSYFVRTDNSFDVVFERVTRIKIFSEAGIRWAEVEIPFYQEGGIYEKVYDIEAYTYNFENGMLIKKAFVQSNVYDEKVNNYWSLKKFALPDVKEGSVIEYRYKVSSQYKFNLRDWEFQWRIPVIYSEYEVKMIPFYEYTFLLQGASRFDTYTSRADKGNTRQFGSIEFNDLVHTYIMRNLPAFYDEELISSINDYIIKVDFQLSKINYPDGVKLDIITTWEALIKELLKHKDFGKYIEKSEKLAPKVIDIRKVIEMTDKEKLFLILEYVKSNYNWNTYNGKYASKTPQKLIVEKLGNCADINLMIVGLLNKTGIEAYPVLISTRENGKIKYDYPYSHFFNYVIILAIVDGEKILTDGTEVFNLNDRIPARCINDKGLIIKDDLIEWIGLECKSPSEVSTKYDISYGMGNELDVSVKQVSTEYDALYFRKNYSDDRDKIKKIKDITDIIVLDSTISVQNQFEKEKPYILTYNAKYKPEFVNDKLYINPFLNESISDNPLKQTTRRYPVDMTYPKRRTYSTIITIPEGYKVEYLPDEQRVGNKFFEMNYIVRSNDKEVIIDFDYYFKKSIYEANEYTLIKAYFNEIIKKGNEKIVLSKKIS